MTNFSTKYDDETVERNISAYNLLDIIEKHIHGNVHDINYTKTNNCYIKKIRVFENGKSVETFSIQNLKICKLNEKGEDYIQIKKLKKKAVKHVHFNNTFDLVKTKLSQKKKKVAALLINVHGNVYYADGSRRYDE